MCTSTRAHHLTPRQYEVLTLLDQGRSTHGIAEHLGLSLETVRNHVRAVLRAFGVEHVPKRGRAMLIVRKLQTLGTVHRVQPPATAFASSRNLRSAEIGEFR